MAEKSEKRDYGKKQFYPQRQFRLSEDNIEWLKSIKRGTWNNTFNSIRRNYGHKRK